MAEDSWAPIADHFVTDHYASLRGRVRTHVIHEHLLAHLPPPPARLVDVGGGAGTQSIPLARLGHPVTIVDSSPAMLARASEALATEPAAVRDRIRLVEADAERAPAVLGRHGFDGVLCHSGRETAR